MIRFLQIGNDASILTLSLAVARLPPGDDYTTAPSRYYSQKFYEQAGGLEIFVTRREPSDCGD